MSEGKPLSTCGPLISELECKIIQAQICRRAQYRIQYLKDRTDPCKHSKEAGFVFDPAVQHFISMKSCQYYSWTANPRTAIMGIVMILPFFIYGSIIYKHRSERERSIRCGFLRYRDRLFKLC